MCTHPPTTHTLGTHTLGRFSNSLVLMLVKVRTDARNHENKQLGRLGPNYMSIRPQTSRLYLTLNVNLKKEHIYPLQA